VESRSIRRGLSANDHGSFGCVKRRHGAADAFKVAV